MENENATKPQPDLLSREMKSHSRSQRESSLSGNESASSMSIFAEQAFWRAAGSRLIPGNSVRILKDADENYPSWLKAIESAQRTIHFESYIIHEDQQGQVFADALIERARGGVCVRLIYDWVGALNATSNKFWRHLREAGVEVRCFNRPRVDNPFGTFGPFDWLGPDLPKRICVDGQVGLVGGLCVGAMWVGDAGAGVEPWRDTGVEIRGPALAELERAFAQMWAACGQPIPAVEVPELNSIQPSGDV